MSEAARLVPARFLSLIAHLIVGSLLIWDLNATTETCSGTLATSETASSIRTRLTIGLAMMFVFLALELGGLLSGVTMFMPAQSLLSVGCHSSATVSLLFFMFDSWTCNYFWYIFGFCSVFPAVTELLSIVSFAKGWTL